MRMLSRNTLAAFAGAAMAALLAVPAQAQDISRTPGRGEVALTAGFLPDPHEVQIVSGGTTDASAVGCVGWIADAPDYRVHYEAGQGPLAFAFVADEGDTTLLVNTPDGNWHCNDDYNGSVDPALVFDAPLSGQYDIWVGSFNEGQYLNGVLRVTELPATVLGGQSGGQAQAPNGPMGLLGGGINPDCGDTGLPATFGCVRLLSGFTPDPVRVALQAGGGRAASTFMAQCPGFVADEPDYQVIFEAGQAPLIISVDSMADTTLLINAANGQWFCDDDGGNKGFNPAITFQAPLSGRYDIWVGTFESGSLQPASLSISELYSE